MILRRINYQQTEEPPKENTSIYGAFHQIFSRCKQNNIVGIYQFLPRAACGYYVYEGREGD